MCPPGLVVVALALSVGVGARASVAGPERVSALLPGDLVFGALFSVHHQPKQGRSANALACGDVRELYGIQRVEATFMTLDRINGDQNILPNVTLGVEMRDSCWYAPVALQQSIEFIRDAISPASLAAGDAACVPEVQTDALLPAAHDKRKGVEGRPPLVGVVGPASSSVAIQVQNLLQLFHIPQVGYSTTSRDLSDKGRFGFFLRVVPSDYYQAQVMVDVVRRHNWTYVSAVNTDENYGQSGIQAFRELAEKANVCIAKEDSVLSNAEDEVFEAVIRKLSEDQHAKVVVCFCEGMTVRGLLRASRTLNLTDRFLFLGSDGWADRNDVTDGLEEQARGSLSIRIHSPLVKDFDSYYFSLNPFNNSRNPWFREFWQARFNCSLPSNETLDPDVRVCTGEERLSERYKRDPKLSFVIKAIYTMAHGLHDLREAVCGPQTVGLCPDLFPFNGTLFRSFLMNVTFTHDGDDIEFDRRGDPPGRYDIMNFQMLTNGSYDYVQVGEWNNGTLILDKEMQFTHDNIESVCAKPCQPGYYRNFQRGGQEKRCCWVCVPCDRNEFLLNETSCQRCPDGWWPNTNKTACVKIPVEYVQWSDSQAIVAMAFSCLGFAATAFAGSVFVRHNDTPVVKASTRELSYLILAGMALSHAATFPVLAEPSTLSCSLARVLPGLSFAMVYGALVTKTNRIARILAGSKKRFPTRKPRFMSAAAQVVITCILIAIEAGVAVMMLVLEPAAPTHLYPALDRVVLACNTSALGVLAPLAFDFVLIAFCTLYALKTRNVPENFNEAKFIGFAMYTTCVIWIAFVPIYFGSESKVITLCMCVTLSAMVTLVFLFLPKLYIIILHPERNNRALFTTSKSIRCHIGSRVASAITSNPSHCYCAESPRDRLSKSDNRSSGDPRAWRTGSINFPDLAQPKVQCRTLSVQTGADLLEMLLQTHMKPATLQPRTSVEWLELSPQALLESTSYRSAHIFEESVSDQSGDEDSGHLKNITISLGGGLSPTFSHSTPASPISLWSHKSGSTCNEQ